MNPNIDILIAVKYRDLVKISFTDLKDDERSILLDENRRDFRKSFQKFQMFRNCSGLDSNEFTVSFQKSEGLGAGVVFREKLGLRKNR